MSQKTDLILPLARLLQFCGRHFTMIRALSWDAMSFDPKRPNSLSQVREAADTVHNLANVGWHIEEYVEGRASGRALLESCEGVLRQVKLAEENKDPDRFTLFQWSRAREALEEIISKIEIIDIDGEDIPTASENMRQAMDRMKEKILTDRENRNEA